MKTVKRTILGLYGFWVLGNLTGLSRHNYFKVSIAMLMVLLVLLNIVYLTFNVRDAKKLYKAGDVDSLRKNMKALKFGLVPFFMINFFSHAGFVILLLIMFAPVSFIYAFFVGVFTYFIVVCSSAYGIYYIKLLRNEGEISRKTMVRHIILQLCFVLDVFDTIHIVRKYK